MYTANDVYLLPPNVQSPDGNWYIILHNSNPNSGVVSYRVNITASFMVLLKILYLLVRPSLYYVQARSYCPRYAPESPDIPVMQGAIVRTVEFENILLGPTYTGLVQVGSIALEPYETGPIMTVQLNAADLNGSSAYLATVFMNNSLGQSIQVGGFEFYVDVNNTYQRAWPDNWIGGRTNR